MPLRGLRPPLEKCRHLSDTKYCPLLATPCLERSCSALPGTTYRAGPHDSAGDVGSPERDQQVLKGTESGHV